MNKSKYPIYVISKNRVDVIFEIIEGEDTVVGSITFNGNNERIAGRKVTEKIKAPNTPIATIFTRELNGGESEAFIERKPIAVVREVRNIG